MENRNIEELANNFVFRYVSNSKHFNINQLIKIIKYPTNNMILDVITRSNKLEPLRFTPLVIDFDVKDEEVFNGFNCDQIISDIKDIAFDILSDYDLNIDNYDSNLFNYLCSICDFEFNNHQLVIDEYIKEFNSFVKAIVQKKNNKFNFHIIYPFVIVEDKDRIYDNIKERLNEIYGIDFNGIIDNHLKTNSLRVINCSKKDRSVEDEYYIDTVNSDVSDEFINTKRNGLNDINERILKLNIMLCSLQWSRCGLINGYTFIPKDDIKDDISDNISDDEINSSDENNSDNEVLSDCGDEFDIKEYVNANCNEEIKELSKYSIDDVIYALDNFEDDYWKNQNYDEWRNTIWSCRWFSDSLNDEDDIIYDKVITKCKLYPGGINKKQFRQIWNDYDNNRGDKIRGKLMVNFKNKCRDKYNERFDINNITYREEIEEIKLYNNNCNMKFMKQLLKEKRYDELIDYYIHYFYRTNDGYYYYNNNSIIKNTYKNFEEDKINVIINENGKNRRISIGEVINCNIEKVRFIIDDGILTDKYDDKPLLYKINYYNKQNEIVNYELHLNNSFIVREWTKSEVFNYDFENDTEGILKNEDIKTGYNKIMYHIEHVICRDNKDKINYLMSFTKNIFNKKRNATAPILYGDRRIGKSVFCQLFQKMMPELYCSSANGDIVKSDKSGVIFDNMVCVLEEVSDDFKTAAETCQRIKEYITAETVGCRKLFHDQKQMINRTSFIINTNNIESIYFDGKDDARYVVFEVSNEHKEDIKYFRELFKAYNNINVLRYFYWNVKNNKDYDYDTRIVLKTEEKIKAINKKFKSMYVEFLEQLFLEMLLTKRDNILLNDAWKHFNINYNYRAKKIKMKEFNEEMREINIVNKELNKYRHCREFITYQKLQQYIVNDLRLYDNVESINKNDIECKIFKCFSESVDIE